MPGEIGSAVVKAFIALVQDKNESAQKDQCNQYQDDIADRVLEVVVVNSCQEPIKPADQ